MHRNGALLYIATIDIKLNLHVASFLLLFFIHNRVDAWQPIRSLREL